MERVHWLPGEMMEVVQEQQVVLVFFAVRGMEHEMVWVHEVEWVQALVHV